MIRISYSEKVTKTLAQYESGLLSHSGYIFEIGDLHRREVERVKEESKPFRLIEASGAATLHPRYFDSFEAVMDRVDNYISNYGISHNTDNIVGSRDSLWVRTFVDNEGDPATFIVENRKA